MNIYSDFDRENDVNKTVRPRNSILNDVTSKLTYRINSGKILNQKYVIGKVIDCREDSVTYVANDFASGNKVAVKEYYPDNIAARTPGSDLVTPADSNSSHQFESGLRDFIKKAEYLNQFNGIAGFNDILDIFVENNTGYVVTELPDGATLNELINKNGTFSAEVTTVVIAGLLRTLSELEKVGIVWSSLSSHNVYVTRNRQIKLFGLCPENVLIAPDGYIHINGFLPVINSDVETAAVKSVASLGYYMLSGTMLADGKTAASLLGDDSAKRLGAYLEKVYHSEGTAYSASAVLSDVSKKIKVKSESKKTKATKQTKPTKKQNEPKDTSKPEAPSQTIKISVKPTVPKKRKTPKILMLIFSVVILSALICFLIFTGGAELENADVKSIKYSMDGSAYTELSVQEPVGLPGIENLKHDFSEIKVDNIGKSTAAFYLDIEADSSCQLTVKHNGFDAAKCKQEDGTYKLDTTGIDDGKIVITSTRSKICKSTYTISYTRKTLAKLDNIRYSVDSGAFVPVEDFDKDKTDSNINPPETAKTVTIEFVKGSGLERTFTVNGKTQDNSIIDVTPGEQSRTIKAEVTVTDPSCKKEPNTYVVNINVKAKSEDEKKEEKINIPTVTGKSEAQAKAAIVSAGGNVKVIYANHDSVIKGYVIKQSVRGEAKKGTTVTLTVSKGPGDNSTPVADPNAVARQKAQQVVEKLTIEVAYAQKEADLAQAAYDTANAQFNDAESKKNAVIQAEENLKKAKEQLKNANSDFEAYNTANDAVRLAEAALKVAKDNYNQADYNAKKSALDGAKTELGKKDSALANRKKQLKAAKEELAKYN